MRNLLAKVGAITACVVASTALAATPAQATSYYCSGECTTPIMWANGVGHFVDISIQNCDMPHCIPCNWTVRDVDSNVVVGSGWVQPGEPYGKRINGLYGRYTLRISNYSCGGYIDNE